MVLSFSDAITESITANGRQLGSDGLLKMVGSIDTTRPDEIVEKLVDQLSSGHRNSLSSDDATIMLIQATGGSTSLKNSLLAPFRLIKSSSDATELVEA